MGKRGDINVIDLEQLKINLPTFETDLPAGAPRWMQTTSGYKLTLVNGVATFRDGEHTGNLPGRLVRNPHTYVGRVGVHSDLNQRPSPLLDWVH